MGATPNIIAIGSAALSGPQPQDLTTVDLVRKYLDTANTPAPPPNAAPLDNTILQLGVTSVSNYWLERTGLGSLNSLVDYDERYDGTGSDRLFVRNPPIVSVSALSLGGSAMQASPDGFASGWVVDNSRKSVSYIGGRGGARGAYLRGTSGFQAASAAFPRALQNVRIVYTAGYGLQVPAEPATVPANVAGLAVVNAAAWQRDLGVRYAATGVPFLLVQEAQAALVPGQYALGAAGVYIFASGDVGQKVSIGYWARATPADVMEKVTAQVAINSRRRGWLDQASIMLTQGGTTTYRSWEIPPDIERCIQLYTRRAVIYG